MALPNPAAEKVPGGYKYGWNDPEMKPLHVMKKGLSREVVEEISRIKGEPQWMTDLRLKAYRHFEARPMPTWGGDMSQIDFQDIYYYVTATDKAVQSWDDVPDYIRRTYDRLGIPEAEKKYLAGVGGQYDSEVVYHNIRADLEKLGVIFLGTDEALVKYPEIFKEYFGTVIPPNDNKLAALNTAVWSGGSFIYVPKGVHVELPLQAYFRINTENMGQF
jgi:Fe-S cluster assembly protein SufB